MKEQEDTRVVEPCYGQCRATAATNETKGDTAPLHSPLPWTQSHCAGADGFWRTQVRDSNGQTLADLWWAPKPEVNGVIGTYQGANAELIVRSVNAHHALLAALKEMVARFYRDGGALLTADAVVRAEAAIAKAEGQ